MNWDWSDTWQAIGVVIVVALVVLFGFLITVSPELRSYYLDSAYSTHGVCVRTEWRWDGDTNVFCTDDYNKALEFVERANKSLKQR